jgi:hypothetical protein
MSVFSKYILKLLNEYKRLLKRYLPVKEQKKAIINLGIKRKSLKFDNDVIFYNKAHRVLKDIEYWKEQFNRTATEHSGIDNFYHYLKSYLSHYRIENGVIVHITQKVSCALVQAIQLISLPASKLNENNVSKLNDCVHMISQFGSKDQQKMLAKALNPKNSDHNVRSLSPVLDNFVASNSVYEEC